MGGGSKQTQKDQATTTTSLPENQQTNVDTLLQGALDYYNTGGREYYQGDTVQDFNPYQTAGQDYLLNYAGQGGAGSNFANQALEGNSFFMDPNNIMNLDNIPGYRASQDDTARRYTQNLTENILPSVRGGATNSGQFGGSAAGIGEALSVGRSNEGLASAQTQQDLGAYSEGLSSFNQAQNRAPALFQLGAQPGRVTAGVGDAMQTQGQREIDADVMRHMFEQNEPGVVLNMLQQLTGSGGQYGGTVESEGTRTTEGGGSSPINQLLGGGSLLAGSGIGKGSAGTPSVGAPPGNGANK